MSFFEYLDRNTETLTWGAVIALFLFGLGYILLSDMENNAAKARACIQAGNVLINGNCLPLSMATGKAAQ